MVRSRILTMNPSEEQGTTINCVYCQVIYPDFPSKDCSVCKGVGSYFLPARMMDRFTQNIELLQDLQYYFQAIQEEPLDAQRLFHLIEKLHLYRFDLLEALIQQYKTFEPDF